MRESLGDDIARATARIALVAENRTSQAPYIVDSMLPAERAPFADDVGAWLVEHLAEPYDLNRLAGAFHVSTRTMLRRFGAETGQTPLGFLGRARVRVARNLLETTDLSVGRIAERVGSRDSGTFRRLFVNQVGVGPAEYRRQFRGEKTTKGGDIDPSLQDGRRAD
ncbi:helix-turn-helix domain-containing protein [Rhodococcus spongiicola]|uniref:helix-turn-helix domain-containing protein n=1 Tax=Rhodococcus spongiicola TaxID=2487352 RepID=UPI001F453025|nr:helix-turn-helix domain-containing protein [Rhodococcus spongiicola]